MKHEPQNGLSRSRNMAAIKGKNTKPEMIVRRYLHAQGFRYRLHSKGLPGKPDLVLKKHRLAIFVHGCFWHRHKNCFYTTFPGTRIEFWKEKLSGNVQRDQNNQKQLASLGWRILIIWECGLKHKIDELGFLDQLIQCSEDHMVWPESPPRTR